MSIAKGKIYPDCPAVHKTIEVGGQTKSQLIQKMQQHDILINELGERLLSDDYFTTSDHVYYLKTVELTVANLGFPEGATTSQVFRRARQLGLELCPLESAPYLRLAYLEQQEGDLENASRQNQAPFGSITIASQILTDDDDYPKGFYLRRINGDLWLRGYRADDQHVWNSDNHFIFSQ